MRFELLARALTDAVWDLDLATGAIEWSFGVGRQFGYPPSEAGDLDWWKRNLHPDDAERVIAGIEQAIATSEHWQDEYLFRHKDGSWRWVLDRGVVVRAPAADGGERAVRMIGAMTDITENKRLETHLQLADRMTTISTLAAGIAHEINNPLAYVLGNLELLRERLDVPPGATPDIALLRQALADAIGGATRIAALVGDMKAFARPEAADGDRIDVREVLASAIAVAQNEIRHRGRLTVELAAMPLVEGNASRLAHVFLNLLMNAAQSLAEDRIDDNVVRVTARTVDQRVLIEISDTGVGIRPEDLPHIFVPFYATRPARGGPGLGLSICHATVSAMGGEIAVESEVGRGSTFRVWLPVTGTVAVPEPPSPPPAVAASFEVLVIDDEPAILDLVQQVLGRQHRVVVTDQAREALAWLTGGRWFDAILCDLMMPQMTGMDFYAALLEVSPAQAERVAFLTGGAFTAQARDFLGAVPNPRLEKPFRNARLRELVAHVARDPHRTPIP